MWFQLGWDHYCECVAHDLCDRNRGRMTQCCYGFKGALVAHPYLGSSQRMDPLQWTKTEIVSPSLLMIVYIV